MKVLVVDDEKLIRDVIKEYLEDSEYEVFEAENGKIALDMLEKNCYDLMVLDVMMPEMDGFAVLDKLDVNKRIPTIVLSARGEEYDKLYGFDLGIDDYLTKPFSPKELVARVNAIIKRSVKNLPTLYKYKNLEINFSAYTVKIDDELINLTPKEFEILSYLVKNNGIAISREQLLSNLWGYDFFGDERTVDTHIKMLRNNLGEYRDLIETVRGIGYKFSDEKE